MQSLQYLPYNRLGATPNIIVDSVPIESTLVTLSHWPASGCPVDLKADLSAEIVFNFLSSSHAARLKSKVEAVSNNHFDEDGLVGIFAMLYPEEASAQKEFLLDIAAAGDFGTYKNREAAQVAFVLQAWAQPDKSPLNRGVFRRPYEEVTAILYEELLPRFSNLFQRVHFLEQYWKEEDLLLDWSEEAIRNGSITVEEIPELDFSVVLTPNSKQWVSGRPEVEGARWTHSICHQFAVHNATDSSRILVSDGLRHDFYYRYETWVETVARKPKPRLALRSIAERLNGWEGKKIWTGEDIRDIVPHLSMDPKAQSKLDVQAVKDALIEFFSTSNG
jgi:hypothetical protein